jgi:choline dehydrogenase-like flavoprotein
MLSGIGPRDHLTHYSIPVVKNLPGVGQYLKDHPAVFLTALMKGHLFNRIAFESSPTLVSAAQQQWNKDGTGEMAKQFSSAIVIFNKLPEIYNMPEFLALPEQEQRYLKKDAVPSYEALFMGPRFPPNLATLEEKEYLSLVVFGMNLQGSGTVTLASANPDTAIIDPRLSPTYLIRGFSSKLSLIPSKYLKRLIFTSKVLRVG